MAIAATPIPRLAVLPIAIFRHAAHEGPGYFATVLSRHRLPWTVIAIDRGEAVPDSAHDFSALAFMGGPMSVNDPLAWIEAEIALIRDAVEHGIPVLGHCLGGQLLARALGATVRPNAVKEIGWGEVEVANAKAAALWLPGIFSFPAFHWHGETFTLPDGATHLLASAHCAQQGFVYGPHLGLQCHVEMTPEMIEQWCALSADEIAAAAQSPGVQSPQTIRAQTPQHLPKMQAAAESLYTRWLSFLRA